MREPPTNKSGPIEPDRPAHTPGVVERFPRRQGARIVSDRALTPEEAAGRQRDIELIAEAKRRRKRQSRAAPRTAPVVVDGARG